MKVLSESPEKTFELGKILAEMVKNGGVISLYGDLGTGKTLLTKGIATKLGITEFSIKSPTYTFIREYKLKKDQKFYHLDLYRLEAIDELLLQEITEIIERKKSIIIIEWAEKLRENINLDSISVYLSYIDKNTRKIKIDEKK